jgi:subtilase family serine protease
MRFKTFLSIGIILLCSSALALGALDLKFTTAIAQSPDPANAGNTVTFTVSFKTFGGAVDNLKVTGGVDGANIYERTYSHINADLQRTDSFTWTATAGSHTVWFELDPAHTCGDSNYSNNRIEKAFTVSGGSPGQPNLTVTGCVTEPSKYNNGDEVLFRFTIKNIGDAQAPVPSYADIMLDSTLRSHILLPAMGPGWTNDYTFSYTVKIPSTVTITADSTSLITESNENDNSCKKTFKLQLIRPLHLEYKK